MWLIIFLRCPWPSDTSSDSLISFASCCYRQVMHLLDHLLLQTAVQPMHTRDFFIHCVKWYLSVRRGQPKVFQKHRQNLIFYLTLTPKDSSSTFRSWKERVGKPAGQRGVLGALLPAPRKMGGLRQRSGTSQASFYGLRHRLGKCWGFCSCPANFLFLLPVFVSCSISCSYLQKALKSLAVITWHLH